MKSESMFNNLNQKISKYTKITIILFVMLMFSTLSIVVGVLLYEQIILFIMFLCFGIIGLTIGFIEIVRMINISKEIRRLEKEYFFYKINNNSNKEEYKTLSGERVIFKENSLLINQIEISYDDIFVCYTFSSQRHTFSFTSIPCIGFENDELTINIELDKDLLDEIEKHGLILENQLDYDYFISHYDECNKKIMKIMGYNQITYFPMVFSKNDEEKTIEKKEINKNKLVSFITIALYTLITLGIIFCLTWLTSSKKGIDFSNKIGFKFIIQGIFSITILLLAFIKAKKIKWIYRSSFILYTILYWIILFYANNKGFILLNNIFAILFMVLAFVNINKRKEKERFLNRFFYVSLFLLILFANSIERIGFESCNYVYLFSLLISLGIVIIILLYFFINNRKAKNKKKRKNKKKKRNVILYLSFAIILFGTILFAFEYLGLNYCLDGSKPIEYETEIKEIKDSNKNSSAKIIVQIDNEDYEIGISQKTYFDIEVGNKINVFKYEGLFNISYVEINDIKIN